MARPWAAVSGKSKLPKLYAGRRPADFGDYRDQVVVSLCQPGYAASGHSKPGDEAGTRA
jgi:hypothetical protein